MYTSLAEYGHPGPAVGWPQLWAGQAGLVISPWTSQHCCSPVLLHGQWLGLQEERACNEASRFHGSIRHIAVTRGDLLGWQIARFGVRHLLTWQPHLIRSRRRSASCRPSGPHTASIARLTRFTHGLYTFRLDILMPTLKKHIPPPRAQKTLLVLCQYWIRLKDKKKYWIPNSFRMHYGWCWFNS